MPNPVKQGQKLTILSNTFTTNTLVIFDATGRKVLQQQISGSRSDINITALAREFILYLFTTKKRNFSAVNY